MSSLTRYLVHDSSCNIDHFVVQLILRLRHSSSTYYYSAAKDYYDFSTKPYHSSDDDTDAPLLAVGSVVCLTTTSSRRLIGLRGFGVDWRRVCRRGRPVSKCRLRLSDRTKV